MILDDEDDNFISSDEQTPAPETNPSADPADPFAPLAQDRVAVAPERHQRRRWVRPLIIFVVVVVAALSVAFYIRYVNPYADNARTAGYVTNVERRGIFFKTFEGEMISEQALTDTTRVYSRDFSFSVDNDSLAQLIQSYQGSGRKVEVTCKRFYGTLPWRGASKNVVTSFRVL